MITKAQFEERLLKGIYRITGTSWGAKETNCFEITPNEFLRFAEEDLSGDKTTRNLVNALSNIKRALDCQIELIIFEHGISKKSKTQHWNFPKKTEFLKNQKIVAPRILKKINDLRNLLEHEFKKPSLEQVEDALDIVTLFISYIQRLRTIPSNLYISSGKKMCYHLNFDKGNFSFNFFDSKSRERFKIKEGDKCFDFLINYAYRAKYD